MNGNEDTISAYAVKMLQLSIFFIYNTLQTIFHVVVFKLFKKCRTPTSRYKYRLHKRLNSRLFHAFAYAPTSSSAFFRTLFSISFIYLQRTKVFYFTGTPLPRLFSPGGLLWIVMCLFNWSGRENFLPHPGWEHANGRSPVCVRIWFEVLSIYVLYFRPFWGSNDLRVWSSWTLLQNPCGDVLESIYRPFLKSRGLTSDNTGRQMAFRRYVCAVDWKLVITLMLVAGRLLPCGSLRTKRLQTICHILDVRT